MFITFMQKFKKMKYLSLTSTELGIFLKIYYNCSKYYCNIWIENAYEISHLIFLRILLYKYLIQFLIWYIF